jgi:DNA-binding NtrC family response regulator
MATVLIVDDDPGVLATLVRGFQTSGHVVVQAANGNDAIDIGRAQELDAAVLDVRLKGVTGLRVARELRVLHPRLVCIAITGFPMLPGAVGSIKTVLDDYLEKPVELSELVAGVERLLAQRREPSETSGRGRHIWHGLVGASPIMQRVFRQAERVGLTDNSVLILGETGTGKELMARAIHVLSDRRARPFVAVNCTSVPETLFEDAFFGHVRGAFTGADRRHAGYFEEATGGTLFLDEIGDLPLTIQTKLLRALEERAVRPLGGRLLRVDNRIVAATNADLRARVGDGRFRSDLFHRLNEFAIVLPPLRDRGDDIGLLADHFLAEVRRDRPGAPHAFSTAAKRLLGAWEWPGNVRELRATVRRMTLLSEGSIIEVSDLPAEILGTILQTAPHPEFARDPNSAVGRMSLAAALRDARKQIERAFVEWALAHHETREAAAAALGIDRRTLLNLLVRHGIHWPPAGRGDT